MTAVAYLLKKAILLYQENSAAQVKSKPLPFRGSNKLCPQTNPVMNRFGLQNVMNNFGFQNGIQGMVWAKTLDFTRKETGNSNKTSRHTPCQSLLPSCLHSATWLTTFSSPTLYIVEISPCMEPKTPHRSLTQGRAAQRRNRCIPLSDQA